MLQYTKVNHYHHFKQLSIAIPLSLQLFNLHGSGSCLEAVTVPFLLGGIGPSPNIYQQDYYQVVICIYKYGYRGEYIDTKIALKGNSKFVQLLNC